MKKINFKILLFLVYAFILSCSQTEIQSPNIDIENARVWYEKNNNLLNQRSPINQSGRLDINHLKAPIWGESTIHHFKNGVKAIEVNLDYESNLFLGQDNDPHNAVSSVRNSMLLIESAPDFYEIYLVKIFPEASVNFNSESFKSLNFGNLPQSFSGRVLIFDWSENLIGGWKIINGERDAFYERIPFDSTSKEVTGKVSATASGNCYVVTIYWYSQACSEYGCSDPVVIDEISFQICEEIIAPPSGDPNEGGGGGGGDGNSCFEEHPYIEGLMIPCDEITWDMESQQNQNKLCGGYSFTSIGDGLTAEILGLGATAENKSTFEVLNVTFPVMCVTFGNSSIVNNPVIGSEVFNEAWNNTMADARAWLNLQQSPTSVGLSAFILQRLRFHLALSANGYAVFSTGPCRGNVPSTEVVYCN